MNYSHGTGHGVGSYLNVHEGPQNISPKNVNQDILPGMITSNEQGLYREGKYGIRIENLILAKEIEENQFGKFIGFETLSLCPIDTKAIDLSMLTEEEISWINNYHKLVYDKISPNLSKKEQIWLKSKTRSI